MNSRKPALVLALILILTGITTTKVVAEDIFDEVPPINWQQMMSCPLVVTGIVQGGTQNQILLKVVRVLHGSNVNPGQVLHVNLEHWYSFTQPFGWPYRTKNTSTPCLCYEEQFQNPGGLEPFTIPFAQEKTPAVYFFPNIQTPTLKQRFQIQDGYWADQWAEALAGKKPSLACLKNLVHSRMDRLI